MIQKIRESKTAQIFTLMFPGGFWMVLFFFIPLLLIGVISFVDGNTGQFTLDGYAQSFDPLYLNIFAESVWIALLSTIISLLIAYPLSLWMARLPKKWRTAAMFLVMIPFWTNFLVRTYALQFLMRSSGPINTVLMSFGLIQEPLQMLNTPEAVMIGLVYGNLPFMILPIYTSLEKFDWTMIEAANDLGANAGSAFRKVMLPLTAPGVLAGSILTFVPAIGSYVTADLMGGGKATMIGRVIAGQFEQAQNWTFGSAMSLLLMIIVTAFALVYFRVGRGERTTL
ncbi:MAG TPA: ABC transporter permease [Thermoflexales bacterium]|nr:ABC transporter permease [Thermoflexales bacterium]HQW34423.1 ABC transporter permease [Thermoflexales bacterium]HQZ22598.1 ABC transporter permease [Thermoflexales bacterium]HRA00346.1 ABC transporter permease [Thermoflexales bacterium]